MAFAAVDADGLFEVDGVACESWEEALTWARKFVDASPGARLVVAASMMPSVPRDFPGRSSIRQAKAVDAQSGVVVVAGFGGDAAGRAR